MSAPVTRRTRVVVGSLAALGIALALAFLVNFWTGENTSPAPKDTTAEKLLEPCDYEDGSGQDMCHWDAKTQGNGHGLSYTIFHGGTDQEVVIFDK